MYVRKSWGQAWRLKAIISNRYRPRGSSRLGLQVYALDFGQGEGYHFAVIEMLKSLVRATGLEATARSILERRRARADARRLACQLAPLAPFMSNPFGVQSPATKSDYLHEIERARSTRNSRFLADVAARTGFTAPADFIDALGIRTKAGLNKGISAPTFDQGDVLYGTLRRYLMDKTSPITVVEIGTSHGFSATVMAKALRDWGGNGKILTIDPLPAGRSIWWNTVADIEGPGTIRDALKGFEDLVDDYIIFLQGFSDTVLETLYAPRIHFAFVDGNHRERIASADMHHIAKRQQQGDIMVADDYTTVCPGVMRAADRLVIEGLYHRRELFAIDGENDVTIGMLVLERTTA